jgi:YbbR domain-containing protein
VVASFFRRLAENWKLKVLAFALAVLLWVVVSSEQVVSNWILVPLEIQLADPEYQLLPTEVRDVQVRFSGPARDLLDVAVRRPPLRLTIDNVTSEDGTYELSPRMIQMQGQFTVNALDVRPTTVQLSFARVDSRMIPVRVRMNDLLGRDWALVDSLTPEPSVIRVTGPPQRVAATTEIFTEVVGVIPEDTVFERIVPLDTTGFQGVELSARSVRVSGRLDRVIERGLPQVPVDIGGGLRVEPDRVYVLLRGLRRTVQGIGPTTFRVVVAIDEVPEEIPTEGVTLPLRVDGLPARVQASVEPAEITLFPPASPDTVSAAELPQRDTLSEADRPDGT